MRRLICFTLTALLLCSFALAHAGKTNSSGGHMDYSTGKYHYHHGYPAHSHVDGVCEYDFDDKTGESSGSGGGGRGGTSELYYRTTANLNMRSIASTSGSIYRTIPNGSVVKYMGNFSGNWLYVQYGSITGWVYSDYLAVTSSPISTVAPTPNPTSAPVKKSSVRSNKGLTKKNTENTKSTDGNFLITLWKLFCSDPSAFISIVAVILLLVGLSVIYLFFAVQTWFNPPPPAPIVQPPKPKTAEEILVITSKKSRYYHTMYSNCISPASKQVVTLAEAQKRGKTACFRCDAIFRIRLE